MTPAATWHSLMILGMLCGVAYLSWLWSSQDLFRSTLSAFIMGLGVLVALLGIVDQVDGSSRILWVRATAQTSHWGPFINRNHFSNYLNFAALIGLGGFFRYAFRTERERKGPVYGWISLFISILCIVASLATHSKGGFLAITFGLCVFTLLLLRHKKTGLFPLMLLGTVAFFLILLINNQWALPRTESWIRSLGSGGEGRCQIWKESLRMGQKLEGRGIGVGAFATVFPAFQTSHGHRTITHAENEYLEAWVEWGLPGIFVWSILIFWMIGRLIKMPASHFDEWRIAACSAIAAMAAHCSVDFPMHIPANAWVTAALLGLLLNASPSVGSRPETTLKISAGKRAAWKLRIFGMILILAAGFLWAFRENPFRKIQEKWMEGEYERAWEENRMVLERWPFYWWGHEIAARVATGFSGMDRETKECYERAQRLGRANPMISFRAGTLFLKSHPSLARSFFQKSLSLSETPNLLLQDVLVESHKEKHQIAALLPLALENPEKWKVAWGFLRSTPHEDLLAAWTEQGATLWLDDVQERTKIIGPLIWGGLQKRVIESFELNPPLSDVDFYWQARGFQAAGLHEPSSRLFELLWRKYMKEIPEIATPSDFSEGMVRRAALDSSNMNLQKSVAGGLFRLARYPEAMLAWKKALQRDSMDLEANYGLALSAQLTGDWAMSARLWRQLAEHALPFPIVD